MSADEDVTRGWRAMLTHGLDGLTNEQIKQLVRKIQEYVPETLLVDKLWLLPNAGEGLTVSVYHWFNGGKNKITVDTKYNWAGTDGSNQRESALLGEPGTEYSQIGRLIEKSITKALEKRYPVSQEYQAGP